jgi:hypothetical protein
MMSRHGTSSLEELRALEREIEREWWGGSMAPSMPPQRRGRDT